MGFSRWFLPLTLGTAFAMAALTIFVFYRTKKPFYWKIRKRKLLPYKLHNPFLEASTITANLLHGKSRFVFTLKFLSEDIFHVQITDPSQNRFVVNDVVTMRAPNNATDIEMRLENHYLNITYRSLKIRINCEDFELDVYRGDDLLLSVNSQKLLAIEDVGVAVDFTFRNAFTAYGLPQRAEKLTLQSTTDELYRFYNTDRFAYSASNPYQSLYGAVPVLYGFGDPHTTGVLWLNASDTFVDVARTVSGVEAAFFSESGIVDFYGLCGPTLRDCVRQNSHLTGVVPLPPLFALGYHQSRYSYASQEDVIAVSDKFEENRLPLDSLWLDVDYTDGKRYFTWNPKTFSQPSLLLNMLECKRRKVVAIIDPHVKVDDEYFVYAACKDRDFFVKRPNGVIFTGECWPGTSAWIDFLDPDARALYADFHRSFVRSPILHIWNDMNEPALFGTEDKTLAKSALHYGNWRHGDVHNLYGFYHAKATYDGLVKARPRVRPFVLTRSHFAGSQRFAAVWTGDNVATWEHLKISIPMCLTASLAGFSLCGADIGGFVKHPDDELLQRWYQLGAWVPFFRGHSNNNVPRREPYLYSKPILRRIRTSLQQRYRHLLHWYTLFWQHYVSMEPVMRPLIYQYPNDKNVTDLDDQFLVGRDILVCPVTEPQATHINFYLPGEIELWYNEHLPEKYRGGGMIRMSVTLDTILVFYRGGSIIPIIEQPVESSVDILSNCRLSLYIFCDRKGKAMGSVYIDDGQSFKYLKNQYHHIRFDFENSKISNIRINTFGYDRPVILDSVKLFGYKKNVTRASLKSITTDRTIPLMEDHKVLQLGSLDIDIQEKFIITLV